jgi:antitoxin component YwqK of YwqJK toxin-antitoxin module
MKILISLLVALGFSLNAYCQDLSDSLQALYPPIPEYDNLCSIMGGDSVRLSRGQKVTGFFKDTYPSGKIKHKGYYENGMISTIFSNFYENGQMERCFKAKTDRKGTLEVYYFDGMLLSRVEWINGESRKWEDFYYSGQKEFEEEFDNSMDYYLYMRFYYEDGKPQVLFELLDEKERTYTYKEFYPNGQVKESGMKVQNASINDYQMDGTWKYYDENGKLTLEEEYTKGILINDKKYE